MEIELIEIRDFLAGCAPFDALPAEQLNALPRQMQIRYLRRGSDFPPPHDAAPEFWLLRSGAVEIRDADGQLLEKLAECSGYAAHCQGAHGAAGCSGKVVEDSLVYVLPCDTLQRLCQQHSGCNDYFNRSLGAGLSAAAGRGDGSMDVAVADLLHRAAVTGDADASIRSIAMLMSEKNVSSVVLLRQQQLVGLITDSDLRRRCVAEGYSPELPVADIMSTGVQTIAPATPLLDALMTMTEAHIHHLPVVDDSGIVGMLTATDIARYQSNHSGFVVSDIRKAASVEDLVQAAARLPEMQLQMARANASARHIGEAVSHITDSLTRRLIEMAEAQLGPAPVPYVWLCGGSQARREQSAHSDQDNALLIADGMAAGDDDWFAALAKRVTDGLDACGFVYCPGDAMASNPKWRQPLQQWRRYFTDWIEKPDPKALMLASIFFDLRPVHGDAELFEILHSEVLEKTRDNGIFIAHLAANALQHRPPLGFFRNFVLVHDGAHDATLDIKRRGIAPITDIARLSALSLGLEQTNTAERLRAAADAVGEEGGVSPGMAGNLIDALAFIARLRIQHQADQIRNGLPPDNYLPPETLSELERKHLKEAFKVIQLMQDTLENRYQSGRFR